MLNRLTYAVVSVVVVVGATTDLRRDLLWKIAHFKELWRQQLGCVGGEPGYRLWWA